MNIDITEQKAALSGLGVAVEEAVRRFAGKYELYVKTLRKFAAEIARNGITDSEAAREMEAEELRRYIHGLKGVTANLSLTAASQMLSEIEQSVKAGAADFEKYEKMRAYLPELARKISVLLAEEEAVNTARGKESRGRELLARLDDCLSLGKARECEEIIAELKAKSWENISGAALDKIIEAVEGYDYFGAKELIKGYHSRSLVN